MAEQSRKPKPKRDEEEAQVDEKPSAQEKTDEVDELLDEIDEVLESNAEEFVRGFVQKGGQLVARPFQKLRPSIFRKRLLPRPLTA